METQNIQKGDLEVMGISRSGRVRKKSSKLMDFQSPDEIEPRGKKAGHTKVVHQMKQSSHVTGSVSVAPQTYVQTQQSGHLNAGTYSSGTRSDDDMLSPEDFPPDENEDSLDSDGESDDMEDENIDDEDLEDNQIDPTVRQSIYMSEKANKRKMMKDGKLVYGKAQRKDKGKSRFTAYMLWAKDVRKQMLSQQPDLDFAAISRRLGEMWANVPMNEKCIWKRRTKRLSNKARATEAAKDVTKSTSKFLNRGVSNRSKKTSESLYQHDNSDVRHTTVQSPPTKISPVIQVGSYKVTGIDPADVAAHLRLLGESLSIIGERLKEHEGQITVSGSLSVLLDSLLCSLGPLMCLTTQIPGFDENDQHQRDSLQNTLDNIAYVMPGL